MKKISYSALLSGSLLLVLSACHKSNNDVSVNFQNLAGTYKVTAVVISDGHTSANLTDSVDACAKDDLFHFNKDSSLVYEDAGMKCNPDGSFTTDWSVKGNFLITSGGADTAIIQKLTSNTLVVSTVDYSSTPAITTTDTFTRQ